MRDDPRISAWLDGDLDAEELRRFEAELLWDPELDEAAESMAAAVSHLRAMPTAQAPPDFLEAVQSRIRRRSRGRWFAIDAARLRFPFEAAVSVVLIALLAGVYLSAVPAADSEPVPLEPIFSLGSGETATVAAVLGSYGDVVVSRGSVGDSGLTLRATLPRERVPALVAELMLYPQARVLDEPLPAAREGHVEIRVRVARSRAR
jgi:anti-sigma factor RsiW